MKTGINTTEFWWAMAVLVISSVLLYTKNVNPEIWLGINGFNGGVYAWSRAKVKSSIVIANGNSTKPAAGGVGTSGGERVRF